MTTTPQKYKQTELGSIPEDWEVKKLGDICSRIGDGIHSTPQYNDAGDYFFVNGNNLKDGQIIISDDTKKVSKDEFSIHKRELNDTTILLSINGTIGNIAFYKGENIILGKSAAYLNLNNKIDKFLLFQVIQTKFVKKYFENELTGSTIKNLGLRAIRDTPIPLPPTKAEQTAIANALNDADALITQLEKLIAKKRQIKQGAMQELLKPKEGWVEKSIFELAENKKEFFDDGDWIESEHITNSGVRLIQTGNIGIGKFIEKEVKKYIYEDSFEKLKCKSLFEGDLLICRLAEPAGRACILPNIGEQKVVTSVDVTIFRPRKESIDRIFLLNIFSTPEWFQQVTEKVGGTTHKRISRGSLGKIKIKVPSFQQQTQIAETLSDMDAEIAGLEQKLDKYRKLKAGMMQNLLTGKIRLV